jgi:hypothetical protein
VTVTASDFASYVLIAKSPEGTIVQGWVSSCGQEALRNQFCMVDVNFLVPRSRSEELIGTRDVL